MKKSTLFLASIFLLAGCSGGNSEKAPENEKDKEPETPSEDITPEEDPPIVENKYFLPSHIEEYDSSFDSIIKTVDFEYDEDLLGYKKTTLIDYENKYKTVETYKFSKDFSKLTYTKIEYDFYNNEFAFIDRIKYIYTFKENNSYEVTRYTAEDETSEFVFSSIYGKVYNSLGLLTNSYVIEEDDNGKLCYEDNIVYTYDDNGYPLKNEYYGYEDEEKTKPMVEFYDEYVYENNERKKAVMNSYEYNYDTKEYEKSDYTDVNITIENGLTKFDEQIYSLEGEELNHNVFKYTEDHRRVYCYYGGMNEEDILEFYDNGSISKYTYKDSNTTLVSTFEYNELKDISKSTTNEAHGTISNSYVSNFTYNNLNQLDEILMDINYVDSTESGSYSRKLKVTYSTLKNDDLLSHMDYQGDINRSFADDVLNYGGSLVY